MLEPGLGAGGPEVMAPVGRAVVGHDAFGGDAVPGEPVERAAEEGDGAFLFLVRQKLGVGQARGVVDADVQHLPADAVVAIDHSGTAAGNAVADAADAAEFLGVEVQQLAGPLTLVAHDRRRRVERLQAAETEPAQHRAHGRARQAELAGDPIARQALPAQPFDLAISFAGSAITVSATCQPSSSIRKTIKSRPCGVRRAFLWMFIRGSGIGLVGVATPASHHRPG